MWRNLRPPVVSEVDTAHLADIEGGAGVDEVRDGGAVPGADGLEHGSRRRGLREHGSRPHEHAMAVDGDEAVAGHGVEAAGAHQAANLPREVVVVHPEPPGLP